MDAASADLRADRGADRGDFRVRLLAKRYARGGKLSAEEDARLDILTEQLRREFPPVSEETMRRFEASEREVLAAFDEADAALREVGL